MRQIGLTKLFKLAILESQLGVFGEISLNHIAMEGADVTEEEHDDCSRSLLFLAGSTALRTRMHMVWYQSLDAFVRFADEPTDNLSECASRKGPSMTIAPIVRSVHTKVAPARAFDIFTSQIGSWWPKGRGVGARPSVTVVIEPHVGGRWFECDGEGLETQWGQVLTWSPPEKLVLAWQLDANHKYDPNLITEVEIVFALDVAGGTKVTLTHRHLERFGQNTEKLLASISGGWSEMVELFAKSADS